VLLLIEEAFLDLKLIDMMKEHNIYDYFFLDLSLPFLIKTIKDATDEELVFLMDKYKEKQLRYSVIKNEESERVEIIILMIHIEQVRRAA
jgi:predicted HAD superfamily phosphohydrolase YqeG